MIKFMANIIGYRTNSRKYSFQFALVKLKHVLYGNVLLMTQSLLPVTCSLFLLLLSPQNEIED